MWSDFARRCSAQYTWLERARLRFEARWEEHARFLWSLVRVDAEGHEISRVGVPAQDRGTDAALGAGSGLLVGGPVGAVVGGVIGYTAGPAIAQGIGVHRRHYYYDSYGHRHYTYR